MQFKVNSDLNIFYENKTTAGSGTATWVLATQNTFVDKNIEIYQYTPAATVNPTGLSITANTATVAVGSASGGYYPISASNLNATMEFSGAGWVTTAGANATDTNEIQVGKIAQSTISVADGSATTPTTSISLKPTTAQKVTIAAGYEGERTINIPAMSSGQSATATVTVSGQSAKPTMGNVSSTISGMAQVTLAPTTTAPTSANGKYFVALSTTAAGMTPTVGKTVNRVGYLGANSQILTGSNAITANSNLYYATLPTAAVSVSASKQASTPTAAENTSASFTGKTRLDSTPTTGTPSTTYFYAVNLTAPATTLNVTKSITTDGYITSDDSAQISASAATTTATSTVYIPVASGALSAGAGSATATGNNVSLTYSSTQPGSGTHYIAAKGSGIVSVGTAGYLPQSTTAASNQATAYFTIPTATFTATNHAIKSTNAGYVNADQSIVNLSVQTVSTTNTDPGNSYTANTSAIVPSGGYLLIPAGYHNATKISLATLVPDTTSNTAAAVSHILAGYKAFNKDGTLLTGTIATYDGTYTYTA